MGISNREKYLFDLQGFLVVREALAPEMVDRLNESLDANLDKRKEAPERIPKHSPLAGEHPRAEFQGMLLWPSPWCDPFRELIINERIVPYLNAFLGRGWHMDHHPVLFHSYKDTDGLGLHLGDPHHQGGAYYSYRNGQIRNALTVFQYLLTDTGEDEGGFCCIPGSHKSNFVRPKEIDLLEADADIVHQPTGKAGDLIIFTEALTHGTAPWRAAHERRALLYRYSPKWVQYGPGFHSYTFPEWVSELSEEQKAVLEPAYFYNRPLLDNEQKVLRTGVDVEEPPYRYGISRELMWDDDLDASAAIKYLQERAKGQAEDA